MKELEDISFVLKLGWIFHPPHLDDDSNQEAKEDSLAWGSYKIKRNIMFQHMPTKTSPMIDEYNETLGKICSCIIFSSTAKNTVFLVCLEELCDPYIMRKPV